MSERAPPELSARALIARVARVYMAPRWKGWLMALLAAIAVAFFTTKLVQILEPAINDLMVFHKPGALLDPAADHRRPTRSAAPSPR